MGFVPRLPSWNTSVSVYHIVWEEPGHVYKADVTGQVYYPRRTRVWPENLLYFMFPRLDFDIIHGRRYYYNAPHDELDVLEIEWPSNSGNFWWYYVYETEPRWLGFPNEHICATINFLERDDAIFYGFLPPDPDAGLSTLTCDPDAVIADGSDTTTITLTLLDDGGNPLTSVACTLSASSGNVTILGGSQSTNVVGVATWTAYSNTAENNITFLANVTIPNVDIGPSNSVNFVDDDAVDLVQSSIFVYESCPQPADDTDRYTVSITARNASGNYLPAISIGLGLLGSPMVSISPSQIGTTDATGQAMFTVRSVSGSTGTLLGRILDPANGQESVDPNTICLDFVAP